MTIRTALVLGGGGVAGIAWETGVLLGIQDEQPRISELLLGPETALIGTSAGSVVAPQIASGNTLHDLFDKQLQTGTREISVDLDLAEFAKMMSTTMQGATSP